MRLPIHWAMLAATIAALLTGILILAAAQTPKGNIDPHATGQINLPAGANEVAYCDGCHKTGCPVPHPELVKMTWPANGRVVLGVQGETTCGSCHTRGFRHRTDAFLARDQKGLCNHCHYDAHALSNAHTSNQRCQACHTKPQPSPAEVHLIQPNIDNECLRCHFDGPVTHPVGIPNTKQKAPDLPLSADGKITCVTCHIGHPQQDRFGSLLRKDNRRGGLCLSCHDDL